MICGLGIGLKAAIMAPRSKEGAIRASLEVPLQATINLFIKVLLDLFLTFNQAIMDFTSQLANYGSAIMGCASPV